MKIIKPPKLAKGDTIGVVSPCLPLLPEFAENYERGINELQELGFKIKVGKTLELQRWWSGGTPQQQAEDINAMFADPEVKALIATSGGNSALSVLDKLDYNLIRQNPKPFMGMSDMSAYHLALFSQAGLLGFHASDLCFGLGTWQKYDKAHVEQAKKMFLKTLTDNSPAGTIPALRERKVWREGKANGTLIGGLITRQSLLIGTPYFPPADWFNGAILFWEAVGSARYDIYQMLHQLKYHGVLERISGMLVGTITAIQPAKDKSLVEPIIKDAVLEVCKGFDFPIMAGMDFGHYTVNLPMPLGVHAKFDTSDKRFEFTEALVD